MAAQEGSKGPGLQDLPTECLLNILHLTSSASSSEAMEQVCRGLRAVLCSVEAWKQRLAQDLGVRVSCDGLPEHQAVLKLKKLYKQLCSRSNEHRARFHGCYTDGGCDSGQMLYWVDNLFVPNHWESYCSHSGSNVNCVGLLLDTNATTDQEAMDHRMYLISRCQYASNHLFQPPMDLNSWTTAELEYFFQELYTELQQQSAVGLLLLQGFMNGPEILFEEMHRLDEAMERLNSRQQAFGRILSRSEVHCGDGGVESPPENSDQGRRSRAMDSDDLEDAFQPGRKLFDSRLTRIVSSPSGGCEWVASVDRLVISRAGHFSCPVSCGAVILGNFQPTGAYTDAALFGEMERATAEPCSTALQSAKSLEDVEAAIDAGRLPPVVARGGFAGAEWVEFDPDTSTEAWRSRLRPVIWFRFFSASEAKKRKLDGWPETQDSCPVLDRDGDAGTRDGIQGSGPAEEDGQMPANLAFGNAGEMDDDNGAGELESLPNRLGKSTEGRNRLDVPLVRRHGGNLVIVKLIDHEDLRLEWDDDHTEPNIDINYVKLHSATASLEGFRLDD